MAGGLGVCWGLSIRREGTGGGEGGSGRGKGRRGRGKWAAALSTEHKHNISGKNKLEKDKILTCR